MAITYDFIVYSSRISATHWILGMKAVHGEVPLDIVIPTDQNASDSEEAAVVGVLTTEGLERESTEGLELYHYLRQLNPKKNETFGYNEVVIRNIHRRLSNLNVHEEIQVQITYSERAEPYPQFSYHIKLIGIYEKQVVSETPEASDAEGVDAAAVETTQQPQQLQPQQAQPQPQPPQPQPPQPQIEKKLSNVSRPAYKTTNTLEKLIDFTQNLQKELAQTQQQLAATIKKVQHLEEEQQQFADIDGALQEIFERLDRLESYNARIQELEGNKHQLEEFQAIWQKFLSVLHQQSYVALQEHKDNVSDTGSDRS